MVAEPLSHPQDPGGAATPPIPARSVCLSAPSLRPRPKPSPGPTRCSRRCAVNSTHRPRGHRDDANCRSPEEGQRRGEIKAVRWIRGEPRARCLKQNGLLGPRQSSRRGVAARVVPLGKKKKMTLVFSACS